VNCTFSEKTAERLDFEKVPNVISNRFTRDCLLLLNRSSRAFDIQSQFGITHVGVEDPPGEETPTIAPLDPRSIHLRLEVERWFLEIRDPVFRYLRTMGCPHQLAEEIAQEAFLRLHRALRHGLEVKDVRAWVFRVARNLCIDSRREKQRHWTTNQDGSERPDPAEQSDSAPDPEQLVLRRERIRLIEEEVLRLPELQRECIYLKAQGLRYHEIAAALGIPMTAAVDCVRQAVKRLGQRFHD
jgi:RNA polymerase sigma-70 factor (ECF subfamily)